MKTKLVLPAIFFLTAFCFAQTKDLTTENNSLTKGSWAVQFQVGSNFTLSSFENVIISLKTHFSPKLALRFGVGVNAYYNDRLFDFIENYNTYTGSNIPLNNNDLRITLLAKMLYYFNPKSTINIFAGLGPIGTYSNSRSEYFQIEGRKTYRTYYSWDAGLNGVLGCEYFPLHFLSIFAEYSVSATYGESTEKVYSENYYTKEVRDYYKYETKNLIFTGNTVRMGLSLYF